MKQYLDVLQKILDEGVEKESGRANMPNTFGISKADISMNMSDGFPLLTTKKMYWKGIAHELLWFLHVDTNIKYLVDNNVHIWDQDAYRWYIKNWTYVDNEKYSFERFIEKIKNTSLTGLYIDTKYTMGDLGKVYGYQWRNQNGVDQIADVIASLKSNPYSRYHIIDGWNKADFKDMALPPCHLLYQFIARPIGRSEFYLDLNMYQRSCDTFLGVPFNLASMSLLLHIVAKTCNMMPGVANWIGGDTHVYMDHIPMVRQQLERSPKELPHLYISKDLTYLGDILDLDIVDFHIEDYHPYPSIKAELFTGIKK